MIVYNNKVIGQPGYYVEHVKSLRGGFSLPLEGDIDEYTEKSLDLTISKSSLPGCVKISDKFHFKVDEKNIKRDLVKLLFSNDEQIAIILNKDDDEDHEEIYIFMQQWRDVFSILAKKIKAYISDDKN